LALSALLTSAFTPFYPEVSMSKPKSSIAPAAGAPIPVVEQLTKIMADTYVLVVKTHGAHWNVQGPNFFGLHAAFEAQYQSLFLAVDELAERVRALGQHVPGSMAKLAALSSIGDIDKFDSESLVLALRDDHRAIAKQCRDVITAADEAQDSATSDLLIRREQEHDKMAWMLSSQLGG